MPSADCRARDGERPVVGFCFSFPCEHISLNSGKLIRWTKKFANPGAVGNDPVQMLEEAFDKIDFPVSDATRLFLQADASLQTLCLMASDQQHPD